VNDARGAGSGPTLPVCCGAPTVLIAAGRAANVDIGLWRCLTCEGHERTRIRTDGRTFWVGAMADAIHREDRQIIAVAY
jgi:hypothetical protein